MTGELLGGSGELSKGLSLDGSCKHYYVCVCVCVVLSDVLKERYTPPASWASWMYTHSPVLNRFLQLIGGAVFLSLRQRDASEWGKFAPLPTSNENYPARALIGWQKNLHGARMRQKRATGHQRVACFRTRFVCYMMCKGTLVNR